MKQIFIDYLGILWTLLFCSFTLIALVLKAQYNPFTDAVSYLGEGIGAHFFNCGMIFSGHLGSVIAYERYWKFNKLLSIIGIFTMTALAFVGYFPISQNLHGFFTMLMFAGMGVFFLLYAILLRSRAVALMLLIFAIFPFICVPLAEWIIFVTVNVWMFITSTKKYYQKTKLNNKVQNI